MSGHASTQMSAAGLAALRAEMAGWRARFGGHAFDEPDRDAVLSDEDDDVKWRSGDRPEYTVANHAFLRGKTQTHKRGERDRKSPVELPPQDKKAKVVRDPSWPCF